MEWTPGKKPIHNECRVITPDEMIEDFRSRMKNPEIVFVEKVHIKGQGDIYNFEWTMKVSGKKRIVQYYQNGDRYYPGQSKVWVGVRNCLGAEG